MRQFRIFLGRLFSSGWQISRWQVCGLRAVIRAAYLRRTDWRSIEFLSATEVPRVR